MAELRLEVLLAAERSGESVTAVRRRYGISRETYYRYRRRFLAGEGLEDRSRYPKASPAQIDAELRQRSVGSAERILAGALAASAPRCVAPA